MIRVISIDPGVMTGYCYATIDEAGILKYHPFQAVDQVDDVWRRLDEFRPRFIIVEDFEFRKGKRSAAGLNLFPVRIIGVAELYANTSPHQCALYIQKAAQGKTYYNDNMLKQYGLYKRALPHGMDASRHLLHWCMFGAGNRYIGQMSTEDFANMVDKMNFWKSEAGDA